MYTRNYLFLILQTTILKPRMDARLALRRVPLLHHAHAAGGGTGREIWTHGTHQKGHKGTDRSQIIGLYVVKP